MTRQAPASAIPIIPNRRAETRRDLTDLSAARWESAGRLRCRCRCCPLIVVCCVLCVVCCVLCVVCCVLCVVCCVLCAAAAACLEGNAKARNAKARRKTQGRADEQTSRGRVTRKDKESDNLFTVTTIIERQPPVFAHGPQLRNIGPPRRGLRCCCTVDI
jgi:hypothetical protein